MQYVDAVIVMQAALLDEGDRPESKGEGAGEWTKSLSPIR